MNRWTKRYGKKKQRGMTLIEIMVVITILGLLAAAIGIAVIPNLNQAKVDNARLDIKTLQSGLDLYYTKKGKYPDTAGGLKSLVESGAIKELRPDPWGNEYIYTNEGGKPVIVSYGQDGQPGGSDLDADISSADVGKKTQ